MQGSSVNPPLATVNSQIEVNNSCNCCCFPWRRSTRQIDATTEIVRTEKKVDVAKDHVFQPEKK